LGETIDYRIDYSIINGETKWLCSVKTYIEPLNDYHKNNISIGRNLLHRNLYLKNTGRNLQLFLFVGCNLRLPRHIVKVNILYLNYQFHNFYNIINITEIENANTNIR